MTGAGLKLLLILPVLAGFAGLIYAVQRRNRADRRNDER